MKIVLLADALHSIAAGSERQIYKLAEGLVVSGHDVRLCLLRHTVFTQSDNFIFPCPTIVLNITSLFSWNAVTTICRFSKELQKENVDVVHAYFSECCLLAPLFLKSKNTKIITSRRDMGLIYNDIPSWIFGILRYRTDYVVSNSQAVADFIAKKESIPNQKNVTIYNGIEAFCNSSDIDDVFKQPDSAKLILVANIKRVKRTIDAIKAIKLLVDDGIHVELVIAGEKREHDYVQEVEEFISLNNLHSNITLIGSISEPRRILRQAQIGLLVSESEGLSNTIMEYMQSGLPVIATSVGGNPELVEHNKTGLLINKASPDELASAILRLINTPELSNSLGNNGKFRIDREFSISEMVKRHEQLYCR